MYNHNRDYSTFSPYLQSFPVFPDDESVKFFKEIEIELIKLVKSQSSYLISLVKRGFTKEDAVPVISIVCPEKIDISNIAIPDGILIEHVTGVLSKYGCEYQSFIRPLKNGLSIGPKGKNSSGTLGGFLKDKDGTVYGITCGHILEVNDVVNCPSDYDKEVRRKNLEKQLEKNPNDQRLKKAIQSEEERKIGTTNFSIQRRKECDDGCFFMEDWAIFQLSEQKNLSEQINSDYPLGETGYTTKISRIVDPCLENITNNHIFVYKRGRTTSQTRGYLNGIEFPVKWEGHEDTREFNIISDGIQKTFATNGDSGSWVITEDGELIGMVIGGKDECTLFSSLKFVLDCIYKETGLELSLI